MNDEQGVLPSQRWPFHTMSKTSSANGLTLSIFEDAAYLILLLISIAFGPIVRFIKDPGKKQLLCSVFGSSLVFVLCGKNVIHLVILTSVNGIIVLNVSKRICHIISFTFCFGYLMVLRSAAVFGLPVPNEFTNTTLMIMALKVVGLAFELNTQYSVDSEETRLKEKYRSINPSFLDVMQYSFCYAGILVGPYYKYRTYKDYFGKSYGSYNIPCFEFLKSRISVVPLYITLFLISNYLFPSSFASSPELLEKSFLCRVFYMTPWFFTFRMKMYTGFVLAECVCMSLGFGAYPTSSVPKPGAGPTNLIALESTESNCKKLEFNFETIRCMDEYASEFRPTMREGIRYWNLTVQYWLGMYIYRRTNASKPVKMLATMFVSAIWHGVRLGYYLSLLGTPLLLISEIEVQKAFRKNASVTQQKVFDFVWYFVKMKLIAYTAVAFILLNVSDTLHYWKSIYFVGHIVLVVLFLVSFVKNRYFKPVPTILSKKMHEEGNSKHL